MHKYSNTPTTTEHITACIRCHGNGEYEWMTSQGWTSGTCFRCGGSGVEPRPEPAEKIMARTAEQQARDDAQIAEINERKAGAEAKAAIENPIRWAHETLADVKAEIVKAERRGDTEIAKSYREILLPMAEAKLAAALLGGGGQA